MPAGESASANQNLCLSKEFPRRPSTRKIELLSCLLDAAARKKSSAMQWKNIRKVLNSFVSQRHHRIHLGRAPRRYITRQQRNRREENRYAGEYQRVGWADAHQEISR